MSMNDTQTTQLHTTYYGKGSNRPLVFLHGFLGSGDDWLPVIKDLQSDNFCAVIDLPGHGKSSAPTGEFEHGIEKTADLIAEVLSTLERPVLVGYSMGGRVALSVAVVYGSLIHGLVLEGANPGIEDDKERHERAKLDDTRAAELCRLGTAGFLKKWYQGELFASLRRKPELLNQLIARRSSVNAAPLAAALRYLSVGRQKPVWDRLDGLAVPTLLVAGEFDRKYMAISRRMAERIRSVQLRTVERAGHNVHLERPDRYISVLRDFLDQMGPYQSQEG